MILRNSSPGTRYILISRRRRASIRASKARRMKLPAETFDTHREKLEKRGFPFDHAVVVTDAPSAGAEFAVDLMEAYTNNSFNKLAKELESVKAEIAKTLTKDQLKDLKNDVRFVVFLLSFTSVFLVFGQSDISKALQAMVVRLASDLI
ncbi:g2357 [Coccomyxa elongata]